MDINVCQVCNEQPSKYKCPRCDIRSCSVICVKQHKQTQSCSGERSKTHYVSMKDYNESNMMSDYVYLEDMSRQSDNVIRSRLKEKKLIGPAEHRLKMVVKHAREMGIIYDMLPAGMSRRKANQTNYSVKMKQLFWTLEFYFCMDDSQERVLEHSCPSAKSLQGVFENMLLSDKPQGRNSYATIRHQVRHFTETSMNDWVIGLKKEGGKRNMFINLTSMLDQPIAECLKGERIIEYPTIYIWMKDHLDSSIQLEDKYTVQNQSMDSSSSDDDNSSSSSSSSSGNSSEEDDSDDDDSDDDDQTVNDAKVEKEEQEEPIPRRQQI
ncbi:uncharacterized protein BX664DRAFT_340227 [Halteromyces radiatus]|uniref:uncharacterized protein n=1 Tax=Halteromyces radiatus TaxID=101107 RepID=UPI002220C5D5|nr:uncharacterized protein BX664DRAFT_340227 [Halteromyces radiatus]KAI8081370.1 hypothetical protein BX664DRAFT_340227 [Halteromyces radiatus]